MIVADWVFLGIIIGGLGLGALFGFGGIFKFFTTGVFGIIISIAVCFLIGTAFYGPFEPLLDKLAAAIVANENWFCQLLGKLNIQNVLYYVIIFVIVWILRFIIVKVVSSASKSDNKAVKAVNRLAGSIFFLAILLALGFSVLYVIGWVGGQTSVDFYNYLNTGKLGLGNLYKFINPNVGQDVAAVIKSFI